MHPVARGVRRLAERVVRLGQILERDRIVWRDVEDGPRDRRDGVRLRLDPVECGKEAYTRGNRPRKRGDSRGRGGHGLLRFALAIEVLALPEGHELRSGRDGLLRDDVGRGIDRRRLADERLRKTLVTNEGQCRVDAYLPAAARDRPEDAFVGAELLRELFQLTFTQGDVLLEPRPAKPVVHVAARDDAKLGLRERARYPAANHIPSLAAEPAIGALEGGHVHDLRCVFLLSPGGRNRENAEYHGGAKQHRLKRHLGERKTGWAPADDGLQGNARNANRAERIAPFWPLRHATPGLYCWFSQLHLEETGCRVRRCLAAC